MLSRALLFRRQASGPRPLRRLSRRLADLKRANRAAEGLLRERRRLLAICAEPRRAHAEAIRDLPRNPELESAIALSLAGNRDARAELEVVRRLVGATLLSLASPVGAWDAYDVKPQVFALDRYLALPVFTAVEHLRAFCAQFGFTARDPSGVAWTDDGDAAPAEANAARPRLAPPDRKTKEKMEGTKEEKEAEGAAAPPSSSAPPAGGFDSPEVLFSAMAAPPPLKRTRGGAGKRRPARARMRKARGGVPPRPPRASRTSKSAEEEAAAAEEAARAAAASAAFWATLERVRPLNFKQATPLPLFGPPTRADFVGYFADVDTLLHNASIVPGAVDIVVNPCSPLELVLAREATDRVLHHDQLLSSAYRRVEGALRAEFRAFLAAHCPEVGAAWSGCLARPLPYAAAAAAFAATRRGFAGANPLQDYRARTRLLREAKFSKGVAYDLVILLRSADLGETYRRLRWGKQRCLLLGHADLDVLPEDAAAAHVRESVELFFSREEAAEANGAPASSNSNSPLRGFRRIGRTHTVNVAQPAESFYHDPTHAYTEAHAVFTEELKISHGKDS